jgi:signal transduction histidine kinase
MTSASSDLHDEIEELQDAIIALQVKLSRERKEQQSLSDEFARLNNKLIHNLRNSIGSVVSFTGMIQASMENCDTEKLERQLGVVHNAATHAIELMDAYMLYLDSMGKSPISDKDEFVLQEVLQASVQMQNTSRKIEIRSDVNAEVSLKGRSGEIGLVIQQLLSNALRFSDTDIIIHINDTGKELALTIEDRGIGVSEENLKCIFDPFVCLATYDLDQNRCNGLGLATAANLVNRNGVTLRFQSELNKGSNATLTWKKEQEA